MVFQRSATHTVYTVYSAGTFLMEVNSSMKNALTADTFGKAEMHNLHTTYKHMWHAGKSIITS